MVNVGLVWQNAFYIGNSLGAVLYGVEIVLYYQTWRALGRSQRGSQDDPRHRQTIKVFRLFSTIFLLLSTTFIMAQIFFGEQMWIIHHDYAGGMEKYYADHASVWYQTLALGAMVLLQLSSDGFLIYRFYFVWKRYLITRWVLAVPCALWTATVACGALLCFYHSALHGNLFSGPAANIGVAYYAVAITLNILVTSMSYIQVRTHGQRSQEQSGCGISRQLFGAASFIVEPALPRAVIGLVFLITFALDNGASVAFLSLYVMLTCVCPQISVLHVALEFVSNQELETTITPISSPTSVRPPTAVFNPKNVRRDSALSCITSFEKPCLGLV